MRQLTLAILVAVSAVKSTNAQDDPAAADLQKLQGTWEIVDAQRGGKLDQEMLDAKYKVTFRGNVWMNGDPNKRPLVEPYTVKLDPSKSPKEMQYVCRFRFAGGLHDKVVVTELLGIYEIDNDMLKLCWDVGNATKRRPASFVTEQGTEHLSITLKRVPPKKE